MIWRHTLTFISDFFALASITRQTAFGFRQLGRGNENQGLVLLKYCYNSDSRGLWPQKLVPGCGIQFSLVTPSCHQIWLCSGQGEQTSWDWWGGGELCWRGQCRFLANAQACWRQGGVLITGCMHFVKCRAINLGNYPSIPHPPALLYLPSLSRVFLIKQSVISLRAQRGAL